MIHLLCQGASAISRDQRWSGRLARGEWFVPNMNTASPHGNYWPHSYCTETGSLILYRGLFLHTIHHIINNILRSLS